MKILGQAHFLSCGNGCFGLPLKRESLKTLAVIGPNAATEQIGGYSDVPHHVVTMLEGIQKKVGDQVKIVHAEGVRITDQGDWWMDDVKQANPEENRARIAEAVARMVGEA